jgi:hypothetical protein
MNMPGLMAEAALYQSLQQYRPLGTINANSAALQPQFFRRFVNCRAACKGEPPDDYFECLHCCGCMNGGNSPSDCDCLV